MSCAVALCKSSRNTKQGISWVTFPSARSPSQSFLYLLFGLFDDLKDTLGETTLYILEGFSEFLIYFFACCCISQFSLILSFHISCVQGSQLRIFSSDKLSESFFWLLVSGKICAKLTNISCTMQCLCLRGLSCSFLVLSLLYQNKNTY